MSSSLSPSEFLSLFLLYSFISPLYSVEFFLYLSTCYFLFFFSLKSLSFYQSLLYICFSLFSSLSLPFYIILSLSLPLSLSLCILSLFLHSNSSPFFRLLSLSLFYLPPSCSVLTFLSILISLFPSNTIRFFLSLFFFLPALSLSLSLYLLLPLLSLFLFSYYLFFIFLL